MSLALKSTVALITGATKARFEAIERLLPEDVADAVSYMVTRDRRVAVNEMLVRPGAQNW